MTLVERIAQRPEDGTLDDGRRWWRLTDAEKDSAGKEFPKAWRIDWDYLCEQGSWFVLLSAGPFYRLADSVAWTVATKSHGQ